jgi:hypothetical protein
MKSLFITLCFSFAAACAQDVTVQVDGNLIGTRGAINLESGNGIVEVCRDEGSVKNRITCTPSYNSALISTHDSVHNNEHFCFSSNQTTQYTCSLPYKTIAAYQAGMTFVLVVDATCRTSCTLNIDSLGIVQIKMNDGTTDPRGALNAGEPQWVFYDGRVFRLMGAGTHRGGPEMETVTYAGTVTLATTAGDVHKIVTDNAVGNATIRAANGGLAGQHMWVIVVNDQVSAKTITFGENLKSAGQLAGRRGKSATLEFVSDGAAWYEVARTTNL